MIGWTHDSCDGSKMNRHASPALLPSHDCSACHSKLKVHSKMGVGVFHTQNNPAPHLWHSKMNKPSPSKMNNPAPHLWHSKMKLTLLANWMRSPLGMVSSRLSSSTLLSDSIHLRGLCLCRSRHMHDSWTKHISHITVSHSL